MLDGLVIGYYEVLEILERNEVDISEEVADELHDAAVANIEKYKVVER